MDRNRLPMFLLTVALAAAGIWLIYQDEGPIPAPLPPPRAAVPADGVLFCTWNVENLFDDRDDPHNHDEDEDWFARNPEAVREKVGLLARALLRQNDGRGPDILAAVEVESQRAAELLRDALNDQLPTELWYDGLAFHPNRTGRRFGPAVLSRLPVEEDQPHPFGIRRILEARVEFRGAPLTILASHWTSRLRGDTEGKRAAYADVLYKRVQELARGNPACDVLLAGDFNDEPDDPSITEHLHATGNLDAAVHALGQRRVSPLFDLSARLDPAVGGTYFHNGRWEVLDHIVVTPGLLDRRGWSVLPGTLHTENGPELRFGRDRRPWRFGGPTNNNPRGPSDHFPLTVRLRVGP